MELKLRVSSDLEEEAELRFLDLEIISSFEKGVEKSHFMENGD